MEPKKTTLLILTPGFPSCEEESACLPAQQVMVRALKKKFPFVQFIILTFEYPFTKTPYRWGGNQVFPFDNRNRGKWNRAFMWMRVWQRMRLLHKENDLIGVFSFWHGECALVGRYFSLLHRLPHYNWILGQDARQDNKYVSLIRPRAEELLAVSESVSNTFYIHHSVRPGHILPNGIDPALFPYKNIRKDIDILGAGSLTLLKRYDMWVDVAGALSEKRPGLKAILCGKGPESGGLTQRMKTGGWQDNLSLAGEIPHLDLLGLMQRTKVFLHPSSYEGFSTACLEALYAGAHVISFTHPSRQPIDHWHQVYSLEEMEAKALELLQDPRTDYQPVFPYSMDDNAAIVMQLFQSRSRKPPRCSTAGQTGTLGLHE
jgi:glycosyltransferase involved in cell wall biosynthesis